MKYFTRAFCVVAFLFFWSGCGTYDKSSTQYWDIVTDYDNLYKDFYNLSSSYEIVQIDSISKYEFFKLFDDLNSNVEYNSNIDLKLLEKGITEMANYILKNSTKVLRKCKIKHNKLDNVVVKIVSRNELTPKSYENTIEFTENFINLIIVFTDYYNKVEMNNTYKETGIDQNELFKYENKINATTKPRIIPLIRSTKSYSLRTFFHNLYFFLGHEIGHCLLSHPDIKYDDDIEYYCDLLGGFAQNFHSNSINRTTNVIDKLFFELTIEEQEIFWGKLAGDIEKRRFLLNRLNKSYWHQYYVDDMSDFKDQFNEIVDFIHVYHNSALDIDKDFDDTNVRYIDVPLLNVPKNVSRIRR